LHLVAPFDLGQAPSFAFMVDESDFSGIHFSEINPVSAGHTLLLPMSISFPP
jgi:hypothetical protein